jgi:hypothetical protein
MNVEVQPKDIMSACEATYQAGLRDGVRYSADVLEACKKEMIKRHGETVVTEFCDIVKRALQDQASLIHAKLEAEDRQP